MYNAGTPYYQEPINQPYTYEGALKMYLRERWITRRTQKERLFWKR
ncbi:MAG: hypothetical protein ACLTZT_02820 [Butyricimonas faecalis]